MRLPLTNRSPRRHLSGISKVADPASALGYISSVGLPFPEVGLGIAIPEIVGGIALVLGYRAKLVATALNTSASRTAVFFHSALGDQNQFIHFFKISPWPAACSRSRRLAAACRCNRSRRY